MDVGFKGRYRWFRFEAYFFNNSVDNLITPTLAPPERQECDLVYTNTAKAWLIGGEAGISARIPLIRPAILRLTPFVMGSYVWAKDRQTGEPLPDVPPLRVRGGVRLGGRRGPKVLGYQVQLTVEHQLAQDWIDPLAGETTTGSFTVLNISAGVTFGRFLCFESARLGIRVSNLTDHRFRQHLSRAEAVGRNAKLSVTALVFLLLALTGIVLYIEPHGRVAFWTWWRFLGLSKSQWDGIHITLGWTFIVMAGLHTYLNWKALVRYFRGRVAVGFRLRWELGLASALTVILILGAALNLPPVSYLLELNERIKRSWVDSRADMPPLRARRDEEPGGILPHPAYRRRSRDDRAEACRGPGAVAQGDHLGHRTKKRHHPGCRVQADPEARATRHESRSASTRWWPRRGEVAGVLDHRSGLERRFGGSIFRARSIHTSAGLRPVTTNKER